MNSIKYPDMFTSTSTNVVKDKAASMQDLLLLLSSEKGELLGDPFFGIRLRRYYFEQNNVVLRDLIVDEVLTQMKVFTPQLSVTRKDIKILSKGKKLIAQIRAVNQVDFTTNMYQLDLLDDEGR